MAIGLSDEHVALWDALTGFGARHCPRDQTRQELEALSQGARPSQWMTLLTQGFTGLPLTTDVGDGSADLVAVAVASESCGYSLLPGAALSTLLGSVLLGRAKNLSQTWIGAIEAGASVAVAVGEERLRAQATANGFLATGTVPAVLSAPGADLLVLAAEHDDGEIWFVVEADKVSIETMQPLDLTRSVGRVSATQLAVDATEILAGLTSGTVTALSSLVLAAEACGIARWCVETALAYVKTREQFGRPVGSFQAVKHKAANMFTRLEVLTASAWDAAVAATADSDEQSILASEVAASLCPIGARELALDAITLLGGIGYTWEHDVTLYWRRAISIAQLAGSPTLLQASIGAGLRRGRERLRSAPANDDPAFRAAVAADIAAAAELPEPQRRRFLAEKGYVAPHYPEPWGIGADALRQLIIGQEFERAGVVQPSTIIGEFALPTIIEHGTDHQRESLVAPTLAGEIVWCQLFSEPEAGSDLASLRTRAERVEGGWRLRGQKVWTSKAHQADWAICLARTDPEAPKHKGISYFLVDMGSPGIDIRPLRQASGQAEFNEVFLDDVFVPDAMLVGSPGEGWRIATTTLSNERLMIASGRGTSPPLATLLSLVTHMAPLDPFVDAILGRLHAESLAIEALGQRSLMQRLDGGRPGSETSVLKLATTDLKRAVAAAALEIVGARGVQVDAVSERALLDHLTLPAVLIGGGTREIQLNVIAERVLGLPRG